MTCPHKRASKSSSCSKSGIGQRSVEVLRQVRIAPADAVWGCRKGGRCLGVHFVHHLRSPSQDRSTAPLGRARFLNRYLGLKPQAESFCPFGIPNLAVARCNSDLAQYSNTPALHHSAWPDSRTRTTTRTSALWRRWPLTHMIRNLATAPFSLVQLLDLQEDFSATQHMGDRLTDPGERVDRGHGHVQRTGRH
jgi:hypothetical protein